MRGFSAGKSDAVNLQLPLVKPKIEQLFLYIVTQRFYCALLALPKSKFVRLLNIAINLSDFFEKSVQE